MLRGLPSIGAIKHELRRRVCPRCHLRPRHSESLGPEVVRPCERACPVFVHLPALRRTAVSRDPMISSRAGAIGQKIDDLCGPKEDTADSASPLNRCRADVIDTVPELVDDF
jgi:hypothetical protein